MKTCQLYHKGKDSHLWATCRSREGRTRTLTPTGVTSMDPRCPEVTIPSSILPTASRRSQKGLPSPLLSPGSLAKTLGPDLPAQYEDPKCTGKSAVTPTPLGTPSYSFVFSLPGEERSSPSLSWVSPHIPTPCPSFTSLEMKITCSLCPLQG